MMSKNIQAHNIDREIFPAKIYVYETHPECYACYPVEGGSDIRDMASLKRRAWWKAM